MCSAAETIIHDTYTVYEKVYLPSNEAERAVASLNAHNELLNGRERVESPSRGTTVRALSTPFFLILLD